MIKKCSKKINNAQLFTIACLIIGYLLIENIADASFTSNRGLFMMIFLGLIVANQKELILNHKYLEQETSNIKKND